MSTVSSPPQVGEDFAIAMLVHGHDDARLQPGVVKRAEWPEARIFLMMFPICQSHWLARKRETPPLPCATPL